MTRQFKDLQQLQNYITRGDILSTVFRDEKLRKALATEMSKQVHKVVYARYTPKAYKRRGDDGGLSDTRNMHITKVEVKGDKIVILFENLTMGQTRYTPIYEQPIDSMHGQFLTDTIVDGIRDNFYDPNATDDFGRVVSDPRDYITATVEAIKANPTPLLNAIKSAYKKLGFEIK